VPPPIRQERRTVHVRLHFALPLSKLVYLLPRPVFALASGAVSAFHVLDHVGAAFEMSLSAQDARDGARAMDLHVHVQLVLVLELSVAFRTIVGRRMLICDDGGTDGGMVSRDDAIHAARVAVAFHPLVTTEFAIGAPITALRAVPPHCFQCSQAMEAVATVCGR